MNEGCSLDAAAIVIASLRADPKSFLAVNPVITLPGPETPAKRKFEGEIQQLAFQLGQLENWNTGLTVSALPLTPDKASDCLFVTECGTASPVAPKGVDPFTSLEFSWPLSEDIKDVSPDREVVAALEQELRKHQNANEAFQKALREIGESVTAVARGDLTMRVRINTIELVPEIKAFKRTINSMMDQLQTFASEVSRVAREVGTEGLLGGQARIDGVDGTWKELTDNGNGPLL
jgi:osomolarity two-component system sensor histidine kinase NIK1